MTIIIIFGDYINKLSNDNDYPVLTLGPSRLPEETSQPVNTKLHDLLMIFFCIMDYTAYFTACFIYQDKKNEGNKFVSWNT